MNYNTKRFLETTINDKDNPSTGVMGFNSCPDWLFDDISQGVNLDELETIKVWRDENPDSDEDEEFYYEADSSDTILIGDWSIDSDGLWRPDQTGQSQYSAISREFVVQIVWSINVKRFRTPCFQGCYPNQIDLDSGESPDGFYAFCLPDED